MYLFKYQYTTGEFFKINKKLIKLTLNKYFLSPSETLKLLVKNFKNKDWLFAVILLQI